MPTEKKKNPLNFNISNVQIFVLIQEKKLFYLLEICYPIFHVIIIHLLTVALVCVVCVCVRVCVCVCAHMHMM